MIWKCRMMQQSGSVMNGFDQVINDLRLLRLDTIIRQRFIPATSRLFVVFQIFDLLIEIVVKNVWLDS